MMAVLGILAGVLLCSMAVGAILLLWKMIFELFSEDK
jgi:hypothetical protein